MKRPIRPVPPSPLTTSVRVTPGCAFEFSVLRLPLERESPTVGVGYISLCTTSLSGLALSQQFLFLPLRQSRLVGVGHIPFRAIVSRLGLTFPTRPALPPTFVP
jgi:hypothetical protein